MASTSTAPRERAETASELRSPVSTSLKALVSGAPGERVRGAWALLHPLPGGRRIFSFLIGHLAPYSSSIGALVVELRNGYAEASMTDRRRVRNHLRCLHAMALANLAEFTGNLALAYSLPRDARFIVTGMQIEYLRKARGEITAVCSDDFPTDNTEREVPISIELRDRDGVLVTRATLLSLVGPIRQPSGDGIRSVKS
jgi:acyl-coenzyme A thioesterase PaaI-like protein